MTDVQGPSGATPQQPRTRQAGAAVVAAATEHFTGQGYGATSIAQISVTSGVPAATVYRLFGGKVGILKAALDTAIAGDDEDVEVAARAEVQAATRHPSPRARIEGFVGVTAAINARVGTLYRTLTHAADADPQARHLLATLEAQRGRGQRHLVTALAATGSLRPTLDETRAADIVHTLLSPDVYRSLVVERGWTPPAYAQWLTDTLADQLLANVAPPPTS